MSFGNVGVVCINHTRIQLLLVKENHTFLNLCQTTTGA